MQFSTFFNVPYRPWSDLASYKNKGLRIQVKKPTWQGSLFYEGNLLTLTNDSIIIWAYDARKGGMTKVKIFKHDIYYIEYAYGKTKLNIKELSSNQGGSISLICRPNKKYPGCPGHKDLNGNCLYGGILKICYKNSITLDAYDGNGRFIPVSVPIPDIIEVQSYKWAAL